MSEDQRINVCKTNLAQILAALRNAPDSWRDHVGSALTIITTLDTTTFMRQPRRMAEQIRMVEGLQQLTLSDTNQNRTAEIASWCLRQWLVLNQQEPQNVTILTSIAQVWLSRAQPLLTRIYRAENSSSSSGAESSQPSAAADSEGSGGAGWALAMAAQDEEAERRAGSADSVEARAFLQPATEYLDRAIDAATAQGQLTGDLLTKAAEAYMSLGNTSSPRVNEPHFRRALQLLRTAAALPGFALTGYLQQYLDDYGKFID